MKQRAFPAFVDHRLTGFVGPSHHLNRGSGIVGHKMDNLADRDLRKQFVQFHEDRRALRPDFEHLVVGEGSEATDPQRSDLRRKTVGSGWKREERPTVVRKVRWPNSCDPSVAVDGLGHRSGFCQDLWVDFLQNATDGCPNRAEVLPALQEADGRALCVLDARGPARYLRDPSGNGRVDARDAHLDVPGGQRSSPDEPVRIVEEVVREFATLDLHPNPLDRRRGLRKIIDIGSNATAEFEDLPTDDSGTKHRNYLAPGEQIPLEEGDSPMAARPDARRGWLRLRPLISTNGARTRPDLVSRRIP